MDFNNRNEVISDNVEKLSYCVLQFASAAAFGGGQHSPESVRHSPERGQQHSAERVQQHSAERVRQHSPDSVQQHSPDSVQHHSPVPVQHHSPVRVQHHSPVRVQQHSPVRVQHHSPVRVQHHSPERVQHHSPVPVQHPSPVPVQQRSPVRVQQRSPVRGNRIPQPPDTALFLANLGDPLEVVYFFISKVVYFFISKVVYQVQLLEEQQCPLSAREYARAMCRMEAHMEPNECLPSTLVRLLFFPRGLDPWFDNFCEDIGKYVYHYRAIGPEMVVFPIFPTYKEEIADFFRLFPQYT